MKTCVSHGDGLLVSSGWEGKGREGREGGKMGIYIVMGGCFVATDLLIGDVLFPA